MKVYYYFAPFVDLNIFFYNDFFARIPLTYTCIHSVITRDRRE